MSNAPAVRRHATRRSRWFSKAKPFLGLLFLTIGAWLVARALEQYAWRDVARALQALTGLGWGALIGLTALSYGLLVFYDYLALHDMGKKMPVRRIAGVSFIASACGHSLGLPLLTGGAVRYRFFNRWGFTPGEIGRAVGWVYMTAWLGFMTMLGAVLLSGPVKLPPDLHFGAAALKGIGALMLAPAAGWILFGYWGRSLSLGPFRFRPPRAWIAVVQVLAGTLKWTLAGLAVFYLLPSDQISWGRFAGIYSVAQLAAILSHAPGGLGIFDASLMHLLSPEIAAPQTAAALLAYRTIYNLLPLVLAAPLWLWFEFQLRRMEKTP